MITVYDKLQNQYNEKIKSINNTLKTCTSMTYKVFSSFYLDLLRCIYFNCEPSELETFVSLLANMRVTTYDKEKIKHVSEMKENLNKYQSNITYHK